MEDALLPLDKGQVYGSDVIGVIRYYSTDYNIEVDVTIDGVTKKYTDSTYDKNIFEISYEDVFSANYTYDGQKLIKIEYER